MVNANAEMPLDQSSSLQFQRFLSAELSNLEKRTQQQQGGMQAEAPSLQQQQQQLQNAPKLEDFLGAAAQYCGHREMTSHSNLEGLYYKRVEQPQQNHRQDQININQVPYSSSSYHQHTLSMTENAASHSFRQRIESQEASVMQQQQQQLQQQQQQLLLKRLQDQSLNIPSSSSGLSSMAAWLRHQEHDQQHQQGGDGQASPKNPLASLQSLSLSMSAGPVDAPHAKKRSSGRSGGKEPSSRKSIDTFGQRTSIYRGVTRHRWTGRYEAHLWDNTCRKEGQTRKGRQVYLGGYDKEEKAARAYDLAALKYWGATTTTNFPASSYEVEVEEMKPMSRQEFVASLRRKSSGFSRGASIYRGVTRHHQQGRWQARIGRVAGNKDLYLGTFGTQEEAAEAYDIAAIKFRGVNAVTNFGIERYDLKRICSSPSLLLGETAKKQNDSPSAGALDSNDEAEWHILGSSPSYLDQGASPAGVLRNLIGLGSFQTTTVDQPGLSTSTGAVVSFSADMENPNSRNGSNSAKLLLQQQYGSPNESNSILGSVLLPPHSRSENMPFFAAWNEN